VPAPPTNAPARFPGGRSARDHGRGGRCSPALCRNGIWRSSTSRCGRKAAFASKKPGRVRWEITSPYKSILVSDGSGVGQFEWMDEKWKKLDAGLASAMQAVIAQIAAVMEGRYASDSREYAVTLAASPEGPVITLVPRNERCEK